jgi:hypothetical protein
MNGLTLPQLSGGCRYLLLIHGGMPEDNAEADKEPAIFFGQKTEERRSRQWAIGAHFFSAVEQW